MVDCHRLSYWLGKSLVSLLPKYMETKQRQCKKCKRLLSLDTFEKHPHGKDGHTDQCKQCKFEYNKTYLAKKRLDPEWVKANDAIRKTYKRKHPSKKYYTAERERNWRLRFKRKIMSHYCEDGIVKCIRCKFEDIRALSIDHITGGGIKHRKAIGAVGSAEFYRWLRNNNYPAGFQVLCMNCQFIKRFENNECPGKGEVCQSGAK
jgi:hypothetical protein